MSSGLGSGQHTGFGDCACEDCWPAERDMALADPGGSPFAYVPPTREELAERVREAREKAAVLHEEWHKARTALEEARAQSEFLSTACRVAQTEVDSAVHALEAEIRRETWAAVDA